jgi:hypothetical protein
MAEYRHTETGEVKTQGQWRSHYSNVSLPRTWKQATLDGLNLEAVLASPAATTTQYQNSVRDGVVQDANGNWVENYVARDMFTSYTDEEGVFHSKLEQEQAYQAGLDAKVAESNRTKRVKTAWATYRQELRGITDLDAWPNLADDDWPVQP